jgi:glycosyltransferase A (GT-A) superfamily protein (DUF2064 family)
VQRHGHGLLLGADAPQLATRALTARARVVRGAGPRQAIGPARDGGFWLYGGNRAADLARWDAVAYSRPDTARALSRGASRTRRLARARRLDRRRRGR